MAMARSPADEATVLLTTGTSSLAARLSSPLAGASFDVTTVETAGACLDALRDDDIDIVIIAHQLPDLTGLKLIRAIRLTHPNLPILFAPDGGEERLAQAALEAGVNAYVPVSDGSDAVIARVRTALTGDRRFELDPSPRYRHMIEAAPMPINTFDAEGITIWCNDRVVELLELDGREAIIGESIFEFIHPDDRDLARAELKTVIEGKQATGPTDMRLQTANDTVRHIAVTTAIGEFLGAEIGQAIVLDRTDQHHRDRQLRFLEEWLRHNIRNEANIIHGLANDLAAGLAEPATAGEVIAERAKALLEQADRERELVQMLRDPPDPHLIKVDDLVETVVADAEGCGEGVSVELAEAVPLHAQAVPGLEEAIEELVTNATVHGGSSVSVAVSVNEKGEYGTVIVADDGPGIDEREIRHLEVDSQVGQLTHGRGLGLVYVDWIARLSDGELAIDTDADGGLVKLFLPQAPAS